MALRQFTCRCVPLPPWGGGHTAETDPSRNGWTFRPVGDNGVMLLAREGDAVAASCRRLSDGRWDVGLYWNTPEDVRRGISEGTMYDSEGYYMEPEYVQLHSYPGWGLTVIEMLAKERAKLQECS